MVLVASGSLPDADDSTLNFVEFDGPIFAIVEDADVRSMTAPAALDGEEVEGEGDAKLALKETLPNRMANRIQARQRFPPDFISYSIIKIKSSRFGCAPYMHHTPHLLPKKKDDIVQIEQKKLSLLVCRCGAV